MADTVRTQYLFRGGRRAVIQLIGNSDGTGESSVVKVDLDDLTMFDGAKPDAVRIDDISWNVEGYNYITLLWDRPGGDVVIGELKGAGYRDYVPVGGMQDPKRDLGGTGDIILTTDGAVDGASYNITLSLTLKRV